MMPGVTCHIGQDRTSEHAPP